MMRKVSGMKVRYRLFLVCLWSVILVVLTCTSNLESLFYNHTVRFAFDPHPDFSQLFLFDLTEIHPAWIIVKTGHFLGFGMIDVLAFYLIRKQKPAMLVAILFAVLTEILQLFFNRDGRLYDMMIDSAGVLLSYFAIRAVLYLKNWTPSSWDKPGIYSGKQYAKS